MKRTCRPRTQIQSPHMQPSARGSKTRTKRKYLASFSSRRSIKRKFSSLGEEEKKEWKKNVPLSGENFLHHRLNHIFLIRQESNRRKMMPRDLAARSRPHGNGAKMEMLIEFSWRGIRKTREVRDVGRKAAVAERNRHCDIFIIMHRHFLCLL